MTDISLTDSMRDFAEKQVAAGVYADISDVVRAGLRRLMDDEGATDFYLLRRDVEEALAEPTLEVDLHAYLLGPRKV